MITNQDFTKSAYVNSNEDIWHKSPADGVERLYLERDDGGEYAIATTIVRFDPGSKFEQHVHDGGEEFLVLDGVFSDEFGSYPKGAYDLQQYVSVTGCRVPDPSRCRSMPSYSPSGNSWYSPSGNYQIFFRGGYGYRTQIMAVPTGSFASQGLPVVGCFNSQINSMQIQLLTIKNISTSQMFC